MTVIDIHTHLLPKVDDSRMKKHKFSSMMARYKEAGIDRIVFSPHIDDPYVDTKRDKIESTFEWAREKAAKAGIECTLGSEFYIRDQRELGFIPHFGTHVLCETDPTFAPSSYLDTVRKIREKGYTVILAHVERYKFLTPECDLFQSGLVDFLATDNHGEESLPLELYEILGQYPYVARKMDAFVRNNLD